MNLEDLKAERDHLREIFDYEGGRGPELADEIDTIEAQIAVMEEPLDIKEALKIVLKVAVSAIEEHGYPDDETIADREVYREVYIDHAVQVVQDYQQSLKGK